jgi:hypothetical protein
MNDTTRQLGSAVGVAVLGSVLATVYGRGVTRSLKQLGVSRDVLATARGSVGGAVSIAGTLPPALGRQVTAAARIQFVYGFRDAVVVGSLVVLAAAAVVFAFLPARGLDFGPPDDGPRDGLASLAAAGAEELLEGALVEPRADNRTHPGHPPGGTTTGPLGADVAR